MVDENGTEITDGVENAPVRRQLRVVEWMVRFVVKLGAIEDGKLAGLVCTRMEFRGDRDSSGRKIPHEVPGSEFTLPFDTMLLAISQHSVLDFFGDEMPELTDRGYLKADPETMETSIAGIYAGGDVGTQGPASIVKAAGDGKRIAASIIGRFAPEPEAHEPPADWSRSGGCYKCSLRYVLCFCSLSHSCVSPTSVIRNMHSHIYSSPYQMVPMPSCCLARLPKESILRKQSR